MSVSPRSRRRSPKSASTALSAVDHARELVRRRSAVLFAALRRARGGKDAGAIHDLRVASRRLTEALSLFPGSERLPRSLLASVAEIRRSAGRLRDADVWLDWLRAASRGAQGERAAIDALVASETKRRKKAVRRFQKRLAEVDLRDLRRTLLDTQGIPSGERAGGDSAADALREILLERNARAARLASAAAKTGDADELHEARIAFKQLRYAAESAEPLFQKTAHRSLIADLKAIQDVLGALHDRDVFLDGAARQGERLAEAARKSKRDALRKSFEALSARLGRERERLLAKYRRIVPGRAESAIARRIRLGVGGRAAAGTRRTKEKSSGTTGRRVRARLETGPEGAPSAAKSGGEDAHRGRES